MKIILSGTIESISTRQDGTIKFVFGTQELDSSQAGQLFQLRNKYAKCLLSDTNITPIEENIINEEIIKDGRKVKTQSQRLRAVLYRCWETSPQVQDFDQYYNTETEKIIEHFKKKLE
jgi:hypothetical protein